MTNIDEAKGRVKEAAGDLTDNDLPKHESRVERAEGVVKKTVDEAGDTIKEKT